MTGQKQRSGGARRGSGPHRRRLRLDAASALSLAVITKQRQMLQPTITEEQIVAELIDIAWKELDQAYSIASQEDC